MSWENNDVDGAFDKLVQQSRIPFDVYDKLKEELFTDIVDKAERVAELRRQHKN